MDRREAPRRRGRAPMGSSPLVPLRLAPIPPSGYFPRAARGGRVPAFRLLWRTTAPHQPAKHHQSRHAEEGSCNQAGEIPADRNRCRHHHFSSSPSDGGGRQQGRRTEAMENMRGGRPVPAMPDLLRDALWKNGRAEQSRVLAGQSNATLALPISRRAGSGRPSPSMVHAANLHVPARHQARVCVAGGLLIARRTIRSI